MKTLFIVRHAKSNWDNPGIDDFDRPLNKRGLKDAPKMAKKISKDYIKPEILISSSARRALETAEYFAEVMDFETNDIKVEETLYEAYIEDILEVINKCDEKYNRVMIFGHNPGMTQIINYLSPVKIDNLPTCGVFCLKFDTNKWSKIAQENSEFIFFEYPKNL